MSNTNQTNPEERLNISWTDVQRGMIHKGVYEFTNAVTALKSPANNGVKEVESLDPGRESLSGTIPLPPGSIRQLL